MVEITITHAPLLQSTAQVFILPVSSGGIVLDNVVNRCKTLFPDNYAVYRRYCRNGLLPVGTSYVHRRQREGAGLTVSHNSNKPIYIVNMVALDHPYHPLRRRWLNNALDDMYPKLYDLVRYDGVRRIALLARPLLATGEKLSSDVQFSDAQLSKDDKLHESQNKRLASPAYHNDSTNDDSTNIVANTLTPPWTMPTFTMPTLTTPTSSVPVLDWHEDIYPIIKHKLSNLPKVRPGVRIDIHVPSYVEIV